MDRNIEISRRTLRLPQDVTRFISRAASERLTSMNAEIVRAIRETMARETAAAGEGFADTAPAAAPDNSALAGAAIHPR